MEAETDLKGEFEGITERSRRQVSRSIVNESFAKAVSRLSCKLADEHTEYTEASPLSKCPLAAENIGSSREKPLPTPPLNATQSIRKASEDIVPTPRDKAIRNVNASINKTKEEVKSKNVVARVVDMMGERNIKGVASLLKDLKEGFIEKWSKSLLSPWKRKYCRVCNFQFVAYKNFDSGWISTFIDLRKVQAKLKTNKIEKLFT